MSCGNGKRERTVKCSGGRGRCDSRSEPQGTTSCNLGPCPEWKVGEWSQVKIVSIHEMRMLWKIFVDGRN